MQATQPSASKDAPVVAKVEESFEDRQRRAQAARVLENHEQLIWHSIARHEVRLTPVDMISTCLNDIQSVPQTRRYFRTIAAGMDPNKISEQIRRDENARPGQKSMKTSRPLDGQSSAFKSATMTKRKQGES